MNPMLARTKGPKYSFYPCYVQPKLNGVRALYQNGVFQSRDEKIWNPGVLEHITQQLRLLDLGPTILDGELYVHGWKLQRINGAIAVNRKEPNADTLKVGYNIFDVINPNQTFSQRWLDTYNLLQDAQKSLETIFAVPTSHIWFPEEAEQYFHNYTRLGYEGIMLRPDGPYEFGPKRSKTLWKYKAWQDGEWECIGITPGEGKADIGIGALVLKTLTQEICDDPDDSQEITGWTDGQTFKVGTGFSDEERIEFMQNPPIGKLIRVRYLELTFDGIPFNPSFIVVM